jgi:hypothetical protein
MTCLFSRLLGTSWDSALASQTDKVKTEGPVKAGDSLFGVRQKRAYAIAVVVSGLYAATGWGAYHLLPAKLDLVPGPGTPVVRVSDGRLTLSSPGKVLLARMAVYNDELFAYLMLQHFRQAAKSGSTGEVYLSFRRAADGLRYAVEAVLPNDLLSAPDAVWELGRGEVAPLASWRFVTPGRLREIQGQTRVLMAAYNLPARKKLESISPAELRAYLERFVRFKSVTDPRIRKRTEPVPRALSRGQAKSLAADIVTVAEFYSLPLDAFLGIGAMENNYMDIPGDLKHAVWKGRVEKGDIVLKRGRNKVLVLNPSAGVWQITRETLRYVHKLYLKDERDYSSLPARLRPPAELNLDDTPPTVLTTYAGLLFRDLLDRFGGDLTLAAGAYNGGFQKPNLRYANGVQHAAAYARVVIEKAAVLEGRSAFDMRFLTTRR